MVRRKRGKFRSVPTPLPEVDFDPEQVTVQLTKEARKQIKRISLDHKRDISLIANLPITSIHKAQITTIVASLKRKGYKDNRLYVAKKELLTDLLSIPSMHLETSKMIKLGHFSRRLVDQVKAEIESAKEQEQTVVEEVIKLPKKRLERKLLNSATSEEVVEEDIKVLNEKVVVLDAIQKGAEVLAKKRKCQPPIIKEPKTAKLKGTDDWKKFPSKKERVSNIAYKKKFRTGLGSIDSIYFATDPVLLHNFYHMLYDEDLSKHQIEWCRDGWKDVRLNNVNHRVAFLDSVELGFQKTI